jgi:hypothetical protein
MEWLEYSGVEPIRDPRQALNWIWKPGFPFRRLRLSRRHDNKGPGFDLVDLVFFCES